MGFFEEYDVDPWEVYGKGNSKAKADDLKSVKAEIRAFLPKVKEIRKICEDDEFSLTMLTRSIIVSESETVLPEFAKLADWEGKPCHMFWEDGGYIVAFM